MVLKKALVLATGGKRNPETQEMEGGSCFKRAVVESRARPELGFEVVGVVSDIQEGGVSAKAQVLGVKFTWLPRKECTAEGYQRIFKQSGAEYCFALGWLPPILGLDPKFTAGSHPGILPLLGGKGCHGSHVHQKAFEAFQRGLIAYSAFSMMFITPFNRAKDPNSFDTGPNFFQVLVPLYHTDTAKTIEDRVRQVEQELQCTAMSAVVRNQVEYDPKYENGFWSSKNYKYAPLIRPSRDLWLPQ